MYGRSGVAPRRGASSNETCRKTVPIKFVEYLQPPSSYGDDEVRFLKLVKIYQWTLYRNLTLRNTSSSIMINQHLKNGLAAIFAGDSIL